MKVAVVGSGVSGLAATWVSAGLSWVSVTGVLIHIGIYVKLLNEHSDHEVHLYESDSRPGGHANTVRFTPKGKTHDEGVDVDTYVPVKYDNYYASLLILLLQWICMFYCLESKNRPIYVF